MCKPQQHPQNVPCPLCLWPFCTQPWVMGTHRHSQTVPGTFSAPPNSPPPPPQLLHTRLPVIALPWYPKTAPSTPRGHKLGLGVSTPRKPTQGLPAPMPGGSPPQEVPSPSQGAAGGPWGSPGVLGGCGCPMGLRGTRGVSLSMPGAATGTLWVTCDCVSAVSRDGEVPPPYPAESYQILPDPACRQGGVPGGGKGTPQGHWELSP